MRAFVSTVKYVIVVTCPALSLEHGQVTYSKDKVGDRYPLDTVASFSCNSGYHRDGCEATTCPASGEWNLHPPTCNKGNKNGSIRSYLFTIYSIS